MSSFYKRKNVTELKAIEAEARDAALKKILEKINA